MERLHAFEVVELEGARQPVREDDRRCVGGSCRPHGREQVGLGDSDRHLVVPLLDTQLPASPQQPGTTVTVAPARSSSALSVAHPSTDAWWQCGWATTLTPLRSGIGRSSRSISSASVTTARPASERSAAVHDGSSPRTGTPLSTYGASVARLRSRILCAVSRWPVEVQVSAQQARSSITRTASPALSRYWIADRPGPVRKYSVNESAHTHTSTPPARPRTRSIVEVFAALLSRGVAKVGSDRRLSTPATALASEANGPARRAALLSRATGAPSRAQWAASERVVRPRPALPGVGLVKDLGLVLRHVDTGRAIGEAALAGQTQVERLVHGRVGESAGQSAGDRFLQHPRPAAGGVLLVPGGDVRRTHHAGRGRCHALPDAGAAVHLHGQRIVDQQRQHRPEVRVERPGIDQHPRAESPAGSHACLTAAKRASQRSSDINGSSSDRARPSPCSPDNEPPRSRSFSAQATRNSRNAPGPPEKSKSIRTCMQPSPKWP